MRLRSFLLPLAFCLFLATGCVHENSLSEQGSSLSPSSIRPDIPPEDIPAMELGGRRLVPAMYNWRVGGSLKQKRPKSEDRVDRNRSFPPIGNLVLTLNTRVPPTQVRTIYYPHGVHDSKAITDKLYSECRKNTSVCQVRNRSEKHEVAYCKRLEKGSVLVVQVDYATFFARDVNAGIGAYSVSWTIEFE